MSTIRYSTAVVLALGLAAFAGAAGLARAADAPAPANQGDQAGPALENVTGFFNAMIKGNKAEALAMLWLPDDAAKREAETTYGFIVAKVRFDIALAEVFSERPGPDRLILIEASGGMDMRLGGVPPTVDGDRAELSNEGETYYFIRKNGVWLIDFIRQQEKEGDRPTPAATEAILPQIKIYEDVAADVKAKKFKTAAEARAELAKRKAEFVAKAPDPVKIEVTRETMADISFTIGQFRAAKKRLPTSEEGLPALQTIPNGLKQIPPDAWGHPFLYRNPSINGKEGGKEYDLFSAGPDGIAGNADDVKEH